MRKFAVAAAMILALAATPLLAEPAQVRTVTMNNGASQTITDTVPGYEVRGTYNDIDNGAPMTVLGPGDSGSWRGDRREPMGAIKWGIAADAAGKPLIQEAPNGQALILIVEFDGDGKYYGFQLAIAKEPKEMRLNGDRVRSYDLVPSP